MTCDTEGKGRAKEGVGPRVLVAHSKGGDDALLFLLQEGAGGLDREALMRKGMGTGEEDRGSSTLRKASPWDRLRAYRRKSTGHSADGLSPKVTDGRGKDGGQMGGKGGIQVGCACILTAFLHVPRIFGTGA